jgi:hypothetical protein
VPVTAKGDVLDAQAAGNRGYAGLHGWMSKAERVWDENADSSMKLVDRWNYHNELGAQFPSRQLLVVYAKAGTLPSACVVRQSQMAIDHKLYWSSITTELECNFLTALFNSEAARSRVENLQSRGQWGARDFDKVIFNLAIPRFDSRNAVHKNLAAAAKRAEELAAAVSFPEAIKFPRARPRSRRSYGSRCGGTNRSTGHRAS